MDEVYLKKASGSACSFNGNDFPFSYPVVISDKEDGIKAFRSGYRSAIVDSNGLFYKLKGINPKPGETFCGDGFTPMGCQTEKACKIELRVTQLMHDYGVKNGVPAPYVPAGSFDFGLKDELNQNLCASVFKLNPKVSWDGFLDHRLDNFCFVQTLKDEYDKGCRDCSKLGLEFNKIAQWVGFWYKCLVDNMIEWGSTFRNDVFDTNIHSGNVLLYKSGDGFIACPVDMDGCVNVSHIKAEYRAENVKFEVEYIEKFLCVFDAMMFGFKQKDSNVTINFTDIMKFPRKAEKMDCHVFDLCIKYVSAVHMSPVSPRDLLLHLGCDPRDYLDFTSNYHNSAFFKSLRNGLSGEIPELIDAELITNPSKRIPELVS